MTELKLDVARKILDAALAKAAELKLNPLAVTVLDVRGATKAFAAQDGTPHEAAHAWAELHIPGLGWVGFDPANRCCPDERYIRLGSGFDAQDAAPIRGISRGGTGEDMDVTVAVQQAVQ